MGDGEAGEEGGGRPGGVARPVGCRVKNTRPAFSCVLFLSSEDRNVHTLWIIYMFYSIEQNH